MIVAIIAGLGYGLAAAATASLVIGYGRRSARHYRLVWALVYGAVLIGFLYGAQAISGLRIFGDNAANGRTTFVNATLVGAIATGLMAIIRTLKHASLAVPSERRALPPSSLMLADILASIAGGGAVSWFAYLYFVQRPQYGPLWGAPVVIVGSILLFSVGFVMGHLLWLLVASRRHSREQIIDVIGGQTGVLGRISHGMLRLLDR